MMAEKWGVRCDGGEGVRSGGVRCDGGEGVRSGGVCVMAVHLRGGLAKVRLILWRCDW